MSIPDTLSVNGENFKLVKTRAVAPVSIYKSNNSFLRLGKPELITGEISLQKDLLKAGVPVPEILEHGTIGDNVFYIEESIGEHSFTEIFSRDFTEGGQITTRSFTGFLKIIGKFANAQLSTTRINIKKNFYDGIYADTLKRELPSIAGKIDIALGKVEDRLAAFPILFTHGDLNPSNIMQNGVIDFENAFNGYAGYDLATCILHIFLFPKSKRYELYRSYQPNESQINEYMRVIDGIYEKNKLPAPSKHLDDFMIGRVIWSAAGMNKEPLIQEWRFAMLKEVLSKYIDNEPVIDIIKNFPEK